MGFYRFNDEDIVFTSIATYPSYTVELSGNGTTSTLTGSVYLEREFLNNAMATRLVRGKSKGGHLLELNHPFTSSVEIIDAEQNSSTGLEEQLYGAIANLYSYYSFQNSNYTSNFTGSATTRYRVISIPQIYYDREILSGSFSASDYDADGNLRELFDDGRGGIYSGTLSGTLVGNIFYSEGLVVLKGGGLNDEANSNEFGQAQTSGSIWKTSFKGTHKVPVKIFRCRAPAGDLNASTNSTFFHVPSGSTDVNRYRREAVLSVPHTYISAVGIYNDDYELVALAKLAQPIKKKEEEDVQIRLRFDF